MKKTLIALAVLAASGASIAQVSITGKLGFSYQKNSTVVGTTATHGMAMSDGDLNFTATEDLGGGMTAIAKSAFASRGRDNSFSARDGSLTLVTKAGVMTLGSVESCSTINNVAGAPISLADGHDSGNAPLDGCANIDMAQFTLPLGAVTLQYTYSDSILRSSAGVGAYTTPTPGGTPAGGGDLQSNTIRLAYASGPIAAEIDLTAYAANAAVQAAAGTYWDALTRTRVLGSYDLGVAKIGVGVQMSNHDKASQSSVSVNVPMGAMSFGLAHSMRAAQGTSTYTGLTVADSRSGTAIGMKYDLSKTTNVNASYGIYSNTAAKDSEFRIRLMKSF